MASVTKTQRKRKKCDANGLPVLSPKGKPVWIETGDYYWLLTYRDNSATRREVKRRFKRRADAEQFLKEVTVDLVLNRYVSPGAGKLSLRDFVEMNWLPAQTHRKSTKDQVARHLKNHIYPAFGDKRLDAIRASDASRFIATLSSTLQPATGSVIYRYASSIFNAAVREKVIAESPLRGIKTPRVPPKKVRPPTTETILHIVNACPSRYRALVILTAATGLRQGEAFGVTLDRLNLDAREIHIDRQLASVNGQSPEFSPPKTAASVRVVPLPDIAISALRKHLDEWPPGSTGLVFTNTLNLPLRRAAFGHAWQSILASAGVPHTTFHGLRHYYASLLIQAGESVKAIQSLLGHASAVETLDTYGHLWPGSDQRVRGAVDAELKV